MIAREQDPEERAAFWEQAREFAAEELVFLDETSTPGTLAPLRGWGPRGARVTGLQPRGRREATSCIAAFTADGIDPAITFPGALDRGIFNTCIETVLVPRLRPGQIVLLDNLSVHKSAPAIRQIEAAGARVVFLPRYSPDRNPIEQAFAKLKQRLRAAKPRSFDEIVDATGTAMASVTPSDARHFITHAGYGFAGQVQ